MSSTATIDSTARDFDFLMGVTPSTTACAGGSRLGGMGGVRGDERCATDAGGGGTRTSTGRPRRRHRCDVVPLFRSGRAPLVDLLGRQQAIRVLDPPVFGGFDGDIGIFEGDDPSRDGRSSSGSNGHEPRPSRLVGAGLSDDGGLTWETNWVMVLTRLRVTDVRPSACGCPTRLPAREEGDLAGAGGHARRAGDPQVVDVAVADAPVPPPIGSWPGRASGGVDGG